MVDLFEEFRFSCVFRFRFSFFFSFSPVPKYNYNFGLSVAVQKVRFHFQGNIQIHQWTEFSVRQVIWVAKGKNVERTLARFNDVATSSHLIRKFCHLSVDNNNDH